MASRTPGAGDGNAAIYFLSEGYDTSGKRLMGRQAAGEGFLEGWARHAKVEAVYGFAPAGKQGDAFIAKAAWEKRAEKPRLIPFHEPHRLAETGALFYPGPNTARLAWLRRRINQRSWGIVGITHTTATDRVMDSLGDLLTAPMQPWDAIICTSAAVKSMVQTALAGYGAYLREHFGAKRTDPVFELPIIPLGVDAAAFDPSTPSNSTARADWRKKLSIADADVAVLWVGRFTHAAKANPWPMYIAAEHAAKVSGKTIHLIEAGWFANDGIKVAFDEAFAAAAPSVKRHVLDGRQADVRKQIWFAADIFCSLSDNIQETFGLTPIEAMAAGLPIIVSDWDGYRETVRHGIDGLRVPTLGPPPGAGSDLALMYEVEAMGYDAYCLQAACATAVDVRMASEAMAAMAADPVLRGRMGAAARKRALEVYDWSHIVQDYQALFGSLAERRASAMELAPRRGSEPPNPLRDDPFRLFASYPTRLLGRSDMLKPADNFAQRLSAARRLKVFGRAGAMPDTVMAKLQKTLLNGASVADVISALPATMPRPQIARLLSWLAKAGLVEVTPGAAATQPTTVVEPARPATSFFDDPIV